jgi:hypothetical protein
MIDVVVVRVLFLEPGDKVNVTDVDSGVCRIEGDYYTGEDMFEHGFIKVDQMELASTISLEGSNRLAILGNPCDPVCEVLKPFHVLYFDLHGISRGWENGPLTWEVESTSLVDVFGDHFDDFTMHANAIRHTFKPDPHGYGVKVHFHTVWNWTGHTDYWGEFDSDWELLGTFHLGEISTLAKPLLALKLV